VGERSWKRVGPGEGFWNLGGARSALVSLAGSANIVFIIAALLLIPAVVISDRLAAQPTAREVVAPG